MDLIIKVEFSLYMIHKHLILLKTMDKPVVTQPVILWRQHQMEDSLESISVMATLEVLISGQWAKVIELSTRSTSLKPVMLHQLDPQLDKPMTSMTKFQVSNSLITNGLMTIMFTQNSLLQDSKRNMMHIMYSLWERIHPWTTHWPVSLDKLVHQGILDSLKCLLIRNKSLQKVQLRQVDYISSMEHGVNHLIKVFNGLQITKTRKQMCQDWSKFHSQMICISLFGKFGACLSTCTLHGQLPTRKDLKLKLDKLDNYATH